MSGNQVSNYRNVILRYTAALILQLLIAVWFFSVRQGGEHKIVPHRPNDRSHRIKDRPHRPYAHLAQSSLSF